MTATAKRGNTRFIAVVMGEADSKVRNSEVTAILDYAFAQYETETLISTDTVIANQKVDKSLDRYVEIVPKENVNVLNKKGNEKINTNYKIKIEDIKAPLEIGDKVGTLTLDDNRVIELTVNKDIKKCNLFELYMQILQDIFTGDINF